TVIAGGMGELGLGIEGILRRAARALIEQAIEAEVAGGREEFATVRMVDGRQAGVRKGQLPERESRTALGPVPGKGPKGRDRSGAGSKCKSVLAPPYVRKSRTVAATVPWLYLHGVSSGHMQEARSIWRGDEAKGLSPAVWGRLKAEWAQEYAQWQRRARQGKREADWGGDGRDTNRRAEE
ncbi:transposase, partial [Acidithiobacillus ferrooxidans]|uniref:transposase n=1 Tax=Acidithiobacillus ferrooxidans TaxID=920 RepID=UPI00076BB35A